MAQPDVGKKYISEIKAPSHTLLPHPKIFSCLVIIETWSWTKSLKLKLMEKREEEKEKEKIMGSPHDYTRTLQPIDLLGEKVD